MSYECSENLAKLISTILLSGISGALVMSVFTFFTEKLTHRVFRVSTILGTLVTFSTTDSGQLSKRISAKLYGLFLYYSSGIFLMCLYYILWKQGIGTPDISTSILFGGINGVIAIVFWYIVLRIYPKPPRIRLELHLWDIVITHIVFAATATSCFIMLNQIEK